MFAKADRKKSGKISVKKNLTSELYEKKLLKPQLNMAEEIEEIIDKKSPGLIET